MTGFDVVIPSAGRASLELTLLALASGPGPSPRSVVVVDDRRDHGPGAGRPLVPGRAHAELGGVLRVIPGPGRGPAAARNAGWRACAAPWVCFLDDDVVPAPGWRAALAGDLDGLPGDVVGSQGRLRVPLPSDRRATDWERDVHGLQDAAWATADMAYRRRALQAVGGFDERFPRAYREDADLALRLLRRRWRLVRGARRTTHPVREDAGRWTSVRRQAGNADDRLMDALHGPGWRERAAAPRGGLRRHAATSVAGGTAVALGALRGPRAAVPAAGVWAGLTAAFAWARIAPGPRTRQEIGRMLLTSVAIPPVACWHALRGFVRARALLAPPAALAPVEAPRAVLLDRDATLIVDVPYNGDPARVEPMPGAEPALAALRAAGVRLAVVSNQSGVGRGLLTRGQVDAVNARVEELLGPFDAWCVCPHAPDDGCACRKPAPGLVLAAAARLGVDPADCVVIGDIGADMGAAAAAGARGILVPTPLTREEEVLAAPAVADDLPTAVALALGAGPTGAAEPPALAEAA
jgi:HAD superfamily hydrolase (TIGR01662 family)